MNQKKVKMLRKLGFHPADERRYTELKRGYQIQVLSTGSRHAYQQVKRGRISL